MALVTHLSLLVAEECKEELNWITDFLKSGFDIARIKITDLADTN